MTTIISGQRTRNGDSTERKPAGLTAQLLAAVETFGLDDTRAALRDLRERNAATEVGR